LAEDEAEDSDEFADRVIQKVPSSLVILTLIVAQEMDKYAEPNDDDDFDEGAYAELLEGDDVSF